MKTAYRLASQSLISIPKPGRNKEYCKFIRRQPCCVTGYTWNIELAHTGPHAFGQKANDLDGIPLNRNFHRGGTKSYHVLGRIKFEAYHQISIGKLILYYQALAVAEGISLEVEVVVRRGVQR